MGHRSNAKNPRSTSKREPILKAAMKIFCHYGYDGSTLDKIADEAGVSKPLVVWFFGTKRDLLLLCLSQFIEEMTEKFKKAANKPGQTQEAYIEGIFQVIKKNRNQFRLLVTILSTPSQQEIGKELMPNAWGNLVEYFLYPMDISLDQDVVYVFYSLITAYIIGGNEENYRSAYTKVVPCLLNK